MMEPGRTRRLGWLGAAVLASVLLAAAAWMLAPEMQGPGLQPHEVIRPKRLDAWTIIGPGGGGTFYNPAISPHDPKLVLASTDMTQCFITENEGVTWRQFNLRNTCRFAFDPRIPERIYALADAAGLFRSDDRGRTWSLVHPDPSSVSAVYLDDEGEMLLRPATGKPEPMSAFAVDPEDSATLYAVIGADLRISRDAAASWKTLATGVTGRQIFVDPASPRENRRLLTAGSSGTGVWDGRTYSGSKAREGKWFAGFGAAPGGPSVLYRAGDYIFQNGELQGGIMRTSDGGASWQPLNEGLLKYAAKGSYPRLSSIATSREYPQIAYVSFSGLLSTGGSRAWFGVAKTVDGGVTWTLVRNESSKAAPNMHDAWLSARFGPDWGAQPLGIAVDDHNPDLVYTTDLGRILRSTDGGKNWDAVYSQAADTGSTTTGLDVTTCYGIHFDPFDLRRMFIGYTDIGLFRSEDGGGSWISSTARGVPRAWVNTTYWMEFDPEVKGRMWAAMSGAHDLPRSRTFASKPGITAQFRGGVVISKDGGKSWGPSRQGLPEMAATHILLDPRSPPAARVLYVTGFGRGVFKSIDGGETWSAKNTGLPPVEPLTWRMAMDRDGVLYVVTIRRSLDGSYGDDRDGWLFRSFDGGEHWERMALPPGVNGPMGITPDPQDRLRLYVAVWGRHDARSADEAVGGGVYRSSDGGRSWEHVLERSQRIYDVTVDSRDPSIVYAAGFEASAWRSTDGGQSWRRIPGFNFKDGHRVIPDPSDRSKIYITTFGSSVWHGPAQGDPHAVEDIVAPPGVTFRESLSHGRQNAAHVRE